MANKYFHKLHFLTKKFTPFHCVAIQYLQKVVTAVTAVIFDKQVSFLCSWISHHPKLSPPFYSPH